MRFICLDNKIIHCFYVSVSGTVSLPLYFVNRLEGVCVLATLVMI